MPYLVGVPASPFPPAPTSLGDFADNTNEPWKQPLLAECPPLLWSIGKFFCCVKLRYMVGEVWREGPKFEKSRTGNLDPALARLHLLVGLSAGHSVEFSFLTWWKW